MENFQLNIIDVEDRLSSLKFCSFGFLKMCLMIDGMINSTNSIQNQINFCSLVHIVPKLLTKYINFFVILYLIGVLLNFGFIISPQDHQLWFFSID